MTPLSPRGLLAIAALTDVALNSRTAPVPAKALAARHGLLPRHFETLLQELVRADLLKGVRGPHGGYELARERRRITAGEIVRAVAGTSRPGNKPRPKPRIIEEIVEPALREASEAFLAALDRVTLEHLCRRAGARGGPRPGDLDFEI